MSVPAAYLAVVFVWSTTPLAVAWSSETVNPVVAAGARMAIAAAVGLIITTVMRLPIPWDRKSVGSYLYSVVSIFGGMLCTYLAIRYIPTGLVSVVFGLTPMMSGFLAQRLIGERPFTPLQWLSFVLSLSGLGYIFLKGLQLESHGVYGIILMLIAVFLFSYSGVMVKKQAAAVHPLPHTVAALALSVPLFVLAWWMLDSTVPRVDFDSHSPWAILYLAIFGSLIGFGCYFYVLKHLSAATTSLITLITPVFAMGLGHVLHGERFSSHQAIGALLIMGGLALYFSGARMPRALKVGRSTV
ncbi:MAG: DMT family transporter [Hahellaceae bacterium]|nr:DMT family transporter [Hahellaceae bacterium]